MRWQCYVVVAITLTLWVPNVHARHYWRGGYWGDPFLWGPGPFFRSSGWYFGSGFGWPYSYGPWGAWGPYAYPPTVIEIPATPPVYIEKGDGRSGSDEFWYFCESSQDYYPNVLNCSSGWQTIKSYPPDEAPGYWYLCGDTNSYFPYVRSCASAWLKKTPESSR